MYIHELKHWPQFSWDQPNIASRLASVRHEQGRLLGRMESLGFQFRQEALLETLTADVVKSSEIEGEHLDLVQVRSSVARQLGMDAGGVKTTDRHVEGVVDMMLDATRHYDQPLTAKRLFGWHTSLFPAGRSGMRKVQVGLWRTDQKGPMQVVSGREGREHVHFEAPPAKKIPAEMDRFIQWYNEESMVDPVLRAALAHLWFVTLHPFDDGNGRIARALSDMTLARSENSAQRLYSMSTQIQKERATYYNVLERTQKETLDITLWLDWFLSCLDRAINSSQESLAHVLSKANFSKSIQDIELNERQRTMLLRLLGGFKGKLNTTKWAKMTKSSPDTALRDILDLIRKKILVKGDEGGRSTSYTLASRMK